MHDRFGPALLHGHLQCLDYQLGAQVRRHRPAHDPPAEHVENDGQVEEADERRDVGDVGDPQAIRRVRLEVALDPIRRRPGLYISARRARPAAPAHAGDARRTHHPCDPLAADRDASFGQFGVNPRRTVRSPTIGVNRSHAGRQVRISPRPS